MSLFLLLVSLFAAAVHGQVCSDPPIVGLGIDVSASDRTKVTCSNLSDTSQCSRAIIADNSACDYCSSRVLILGNYKLQGSVICTAGSFSSCQIDLLGDLNIGCCGKLQSKETFRAMNGSSVRIGENSTFALTSVQVARDGVINVGKGTTVYDGTSRTSLAVGEGSTLAIRSSDESVQITADVTYSTITLVNGSDFDYSGGNFRADFTEITLADSQVHFDNVSTTNIFSFTSSIRRSQVRHRNSQVRWLDVELAMNNAQLLTNQSSIRIYTGDIDMHPGAEWHIHHSQVSIADIKLDLAIGSKLVMNNCIFRTGRGTDITFSIELGQNSSLHINADGFDMMSCVMINGSITVPANAQYTEAYLADILNCTYVTPKNADWTEDDSSFDVPTEHGKPAVVKAAQSIHWDSCKVGQIHTTPAVPTTTTKERVTTTTSSARSHVVSLLATCGFAFAFLNV